MPPLVKHALFLVAALGVVAWMLGPRTPDAASEAPHAFVMETRGAASAGDSDFLGEEMVIERGRSGQFHVQAIVNGEDTEFLIDTGADIVALTPADAERLGIRVAPEDFRPIIQTASGKGNAAPVHIDSFALGDAEFRDIDALVAEGLETNLLGQSVLRRLGKVELKGDRMVIAHE